jgi:hypothetical protein
MGPGDIRHRSILSAYSGGFDSITTYALGNSHRDLPRGADTRIPLMTQFAR